MCMPPCHLGKQYHPQDPQTQGAPATCHTGPIAIWIIAATCAKPSQWRRSSLILSTRPPQPTPASVSLHSVVCHPRSKTKPLPLHSPCRQAINQARTATATPSQGEGHGRRELQQHRRAQARRGGAAGHRRLAGGEAGAGRAQGAGGRGPARGAPRPGGRLRRHGHHRGGQGRDHRRVPREEQGQQGAERQKEAGHQRRQLRARLHRRVRQLPVPLQLHRLPGPRQAEESSLHQRRPRDRVRGEGEVQVRLQRLLEVVNCTCLIGQCWRCNAYT